jgi:hypothetical protein
MLACEKERRHAKKREREVTILKRREKREERKN